MNAGWRLTKLNNEDYESFPAEHRYDDYLAVVNNKGIRFSLGFENPSERVTETGATLKNDLTDKTLEVAIIETEEEKKEKKGWWRRTFGGMFESRLEFPTLKKDAETKYVQGMAWWPFFGHKLQDGMKGAQMVVDIHRHSEAEKQGIKPGWMITKVFQFSTWVEIILSLSYKI